MNIPIIVGFFVPLFCRSFSFYCDKQHKLASVLLYLTLGGICFDIQALTLSESLQNTLKSSPQLALFPYDLRAAEARQLQAGFQPNPELSVDVENIAGSKDYGSANSAEYTLALSQLVELGSKRRLRKAQAGADVELVQHSYTLVRLDVLAETARRYIEAVRAQALQSWAKAYADNAAKALYATRQRVITGAAPATETNRIQLVLFRAKLLQNRSENDVLASRHRLAASWGDAVPAFNNVQQDLFMFPTIPPLSVLQETFRQSPHMQQYLTQHRLREAQLRLAESAAAPDLRVGMGVRYLEETSDNALVFNFAMPLGIHDRNQGGIAEARANLEKNNAEQALAQSDMFSLLQTLYLQAQSNREDAVQLHERAVPLAEKLLNEIEAGYGAGRYSLLELINTQQELQLLKREAIEAAASAHLVLLELERLTGEPMTQTTGAEL